MYHAIFRKSVTGVTVAGFTLFSAGSTKVRENSIWIRICIGQNLQPGDSSIWVKNSQNKQKKSICTGMWTFQAYTGKLI